MRRFCFAFSAFLLIFCLLIGFFFCRRSVADVLYPISRPVTTLVIDAGHGGEDGGASSASGAVESHINLAVAKRMELVLGLFGIPVFPLREEDSSLHAPDAQTLRQKKVSDLNNRLKLIQGQDNPILISIHQNSYPDSRYHGAQVFYAPTQGSRELAQVLQETLRLTLDPNNTRTEKQIQDTIFLMNRISCSGVLVECGFLTNQDEARLLQDPHYQSKLAMALAGGYLKFLHT